MAKADWKNLTNISSDSIMKRGVTTSVISYDLGNYTFLVHPTTGDNLNFAMEVDKTNFTPCAFGSMIDGGMKRVDNFTNGATPFFFVTADNEDFENAEGYMIGLSNGRPYKVIVAKGRLKNGILSRAEVLERTSGGSNYLIEEADNYYEILMESLDDLGVEGDDWQIMKLEAIVNSGVDVVIRAKKGEYDTGTGVYTWTDYDLSFGSNPYVDSIVGATHTPYQNGYVGLGVVSSEAGARVVFDGIEIVRQKTATP